LILQWKKISRLEKIPVNHLMPTINLFDNDVEPDPTENNQPSQKNPN
jgi:hypothetical protein